MIEPLTPPECDLRSFPYMPLDAVRLRDSDIAALSSGEEFRAAVLLWCASWHQIPAASLPDDDMILSQLSGFGRAVKEWQKLRSGAMRGWVKCSDGRLYHPVIAEKAREAWRSKIVSAWKTECARIKKHNQRTNENLPYPSLDQFMSQGTKAECPQGQYLNVPEPVPTQSQKFCDPTEQNRTEQNRDIKPNQETGAETLTSVGGKTQQSSAPDPVPTFAGLACKAMREAGIADTNPSHATLRTLLDAGATTEEFGTTAAECAAKGKLSFAYVVGTVKRRREDAAKLVLHNGVMPANNFGYESAKDKSRREWNERAFGKHASSEPRDITADSERLD